MNVFKKAQTATEYMIILAVIIIIALIVVGVMGGIPGLGGNTRSRAQSAYWQSADIGIPAFSIGAAAGAINAKIRNNLRGSITISLMNISASGSAKPILPLISSSTTFAPGETKTITSAAGGATICAAGSSGNSFTINVWVKYTDDETGAVYEFRGAGNKMEGVCSV